MSENSAAEASEAEGSSASPAVIPSSDALKKVRSRSWRHPFGGSPYAALEDDQIATANERLKLQQRRLVASVAGAVAVLQIICADVVFILYAIKGVNWEIPTAAIQAWLAATVVQVIAVVLVITRSLFPNGPAEKGDAAEG